MDELTEEAIEDIKLSLGKVSNLNGFHYAMVDWQQTLRLCNMALRSIELMARLGDQACANHRVIQDWEAKYQRLTKQLKEAEAAMVEVMEENLLSPVVQQYWDRWYPLKRCIGRCDPFEHIMYDERWCTASHTHPCSDTVVGYWFGQHKFSCVHRCRTNRYSITGWSRIHGGRQDEVQR